MDRIAESLFQEFSDEHGISHLPEDKRFEHFASFVTTRRHFSETFDTSDVITGSGSDTGIDAIAVLGHAIRIYAAGASNFCDWRRK